MNDETRPDWVGQRAVAWVIDHAPVPADLAWTLVVIARRCDDNGRGSYQSAPTIAAKTGKSAKQAQRDIVQLRELGLIVLGDQSLVAHLPAGQRPTVYDVPLHIKGAKPVKESRNKSGGKKDPNDTPPMDGTPPMQGTPPTDGGSTPPMDAPGTPPMDGDQRKPLKNPLNNPSLSDDRPSVPAPREPATEDRERDDEDASLQKPEPLSVAQRLLVDEGVDIAEADLLIPVIVAEHKVRTAQWWRTVAERGDAAELIAWARKALGADDNCPRCKGTAEIDDFSDYGGHPIKRTCPECSDPDNPPARCPDHPSYPARTCGACRADRLAKGLERPRDQQPRSGERGGYQAQKVNGAPGHRTAGWDARRRQHADDVPPGYHRRSDGSLVLVNSRDPGIDWEADFFNRTEPTS